MEGKERKMMGRIIGGVLGSAIGRQKNNHPIAGAVIGAGTLFAARRLFPQRYAVLAATAAAAYLTKKWADRAEARQAAADMQAATAKRVASGEAPTDGEMLGDALPPEIPSDANGHAAIHSPPAFWQAISRFNPVFYMIDGFRYGFSGVSDIAPLTSLGVVSTSFLIVATLSLNLLHRGYKLRY